MAIDRITFEKPNAISRFVLRYQRICHKIDPAGKADLKIGDTHVFMIQKRFLPLASNVGIDLNVNPCF
jgi:hypothetical protein